MDDDCLSDRTFFKDKENRSRVMQSALDIFSTSGDKANKLKSLALEVSGLIDAINPFIEEHTKAVCPSCQAVCCINRHSYHTYEDIIYICALGEELPSYIDGAEDSAPCQFLDKYGCTIKRSLRPYRCNWFFCTPLLEHIQTIPAPKYREFIASLEELTQKRVELITLYSQPAELV
jgi:hypothetical protein